MIDVFHDNTKLGILHFCFFVVELCVLLLKNAIIKEYGCLVNDVSRGVRPLVELNGVPDAKINSKLGFSYHGRLTARMLYY